jgi:hypothetical protein
MATPTNTPAIGQQLPNTGSGGGANRNGIVLVLTLAGLGGILAIAAGARPARRRR